MSAERYRVSPKWLSGVDLTSFHCVQLPDFIILNGSTS